MTRKKIILITFFILFISFAFIFVKNIAISQTSGSYDSSSPADGANTSGNFYSNIPDASSNAPVNSQFSGSWIGIIASFPASSPDSKGFSSTGNCAVCGSIPICSSGQILVEQTCSECAHCIDKTETGIKDIFSNFLGNIFNSTGNILPGTNLIQTSSSSSGSSISSSSSGGIIPVASISSSSSGLIPSSPSTSSSSGSSNQPSLSGSSIPPGIISLNISIDGGVLKGTAQISNIISGGEIISQSTISDSEIAITVKDKTPKAAILKLKLVGDPSHIAIFVDGISSDGRNIIPFYSYLVPGAGSKSSTTGSTGTQTKGTKKPGSTGRAGGTGRAGSSGRAGDDSAGRAGGDSSGRAGINSIGRPGGDDMKDGRPGGEEESGRSGGDSDDLYEQ